MSHADLHTKGYDASSAGNALIQSGKVLNNIFIFPLPLSQVVARTEKDSHIVAFSHEIVPCPVTADMTLPQVLVKMYEVCKNN